MRTSSIRLRANARLAILHEDYLEICKGNMLAAMLLSILVYWTDVKIAKKDENLWVWKSHQDFQEDLMFDKPGMKPPHRTTIKTALDLLISKKYVEWRRNPKMPLDQTRQYLVDRKAVQKAIDALPPIVVKPTMQSQDNNNGMSNNQQSLSENQQCNDEIPTSNTIDYSTEITVPEITGNDVVSAIAENDAPANVYHFEAEKKRITNGRIPVVKGNTNDNTGDNRVQHGIRDYTHHARMDSTQTLQDGQEGLASHSQVDIGNEETVKMKAVKIGDANDRRHSSDTAYSVASVSRNERHVEASLGEETDTAQRRILEPQQTPGAGSPPAATPPGGSTAASAQASRSGPPADAAQRTASSPGTPSGAVQASIPKRPRGKVTQATLKSPEELEQDERCKALQQRINEWRGYPLEAKGQIINERKSIRKLVEKYTDQQIEDIYVYLFTRHWKWSKPDNRYHIGAYVVLSEAQSVLQELKAPTPAQNGKTPTFVIDEERNRRNIEAMKARNAARRLAANG